MQTLTHNIAPQLAAPVNNAAGTRPAPVDRRDGSPRSARQLAATFKAYINSELSAEDLEALGPDRLEQLLTNVDTSRPPRPAAPARQPTPADEFAGYSINALMDADNGKTSTAGNGGWPAFHGTRDEFAGYSINDLMG